MGVMQFKLAIFQEKKLRLKFILVGRYFHVIALMAFKEPWFLAVFRAGDINMSMHCLFEL